MRLALVVLLACACRGDEPSLSPRAVPHEMPASVVPKLPRSRDGVAQMRELDGAIARERDPHVLVGLVQERAAIRGQVEDLQRALELSKAWVEEAPQDRGAWLARATALSRAHSFQAAREAIDHARLLSTDWSELSDLDATIEEALGHPATAYREGETRMHPSPRTLTQYAATLAMLGRLDEAIALVPKAAALVRDNPATLFSWLLVQWGRLYMKKGEHAAARQLFAEAHARLPALLEATVQLAEAMRATGGDPRPIVEAALVVNGHPELLALAGKTDEARREWQRYVAALPEAYADHAARFELANGAASRALELARTNARVRDTDEARALVVETALAAGDRVEACRVAPSLVAGARASQFLAWRAFSTCGRSEEARALAARLGITAVP